jgi:hypothetical protein
VDEKEPRLGEHTTIQQLANGVWYDAERGLYHVLVDGHQAGLFSKWRWAKRELRWQMRAARRPR